LGSAKRGRCKRGDELTEDGAALGCRRLGHRAEPSGRTKTAGEVDVDQLLPALTAEVLTQVSYDFMRANEEQVRSSGMFGAAVSRPKNTDAVTQLNAILGRDPGWTPSRTGAENS
jgi:hypothetical protein